MLYDKAIQILKNFKSIRQDHYMEYKFLISDDFGLCVYKNLKVQTNEIYTVDFFPLKPEIMKPGLYNISSVWDHLSKDFRYEACYHLDWLSKFERP